MRKHVLFLTSTNLACNPRCLKEVRLLSLMDVDITVVAFYLHNWTDKKEIVLNKELEHVTFHYLESTRVQFFPWLFASFLERISRMLVSIPRPGVLLSSVAVSKRSWQLLRWTKRAEIKPDLIIAHNPPAFYAAARMAGKLNIPFALDVEDYHPGEGHNATINNSQVVLMRRLFEAAAYVSYASPLIKEYSEKLLPERNPCSFVVNNLFPSADFSDNFKAGGGKLKIVWFSQNVDFGRGLEELIPVLAELEDQIELTLIGDGKEPFVRNVVEGRNFIRLVAPLDQQELHRVMGNFDAGLAIESGKDVNKQVLLSNKIWTYYQAGLFIVASDTPAQKRFLTERHDHGVCMTLTREDILKTFKRLINQLQDIRSKKTFRFQQAQNNGWEAESRLLSDKWGQILG